MHPTGYSTPKCLLLAAVTFDFVGLFLPWNAHGHRVQQSVRLRMECLFEGYRWRPHSSSHHVFYMVQVAFGSSMRRCSETSRWFVEEPR